MRPDQIFNPGNPENVTKLGLETETKPELRFDPQRDIPIEQWQKMIQELSKAKNMRGRDMCLREVIEQAPPHDYGVTLPTVDQLGQEFNEVRHSWSWESVVLQIEELRARDPKGDWQLTSKNKERFEQELDHCRNQNDPLNFLFQLNFMRRVDAYFADSLTSPSDWSWIVKELNALRKQSPDLFFNYLAAIRHNDRAPKIDIQPEDQQRLNEVIEQYRKHNDWEKFATMCTVVLEDIPELHATITPDDWVKMRDSLLNQPRLSWPLIRDTVKQMKTLAEFEQRQQQATPPLPSSTLPTALSF